MGIQIFHSKVKKSQYFAIVNFGMGMIGKTEKTGSNQVMTTGTPKSRGICVAIRKSTMNSATWVGPYCGFGDFK